MANDIGPSRKSEIRKLYSSYGDNIWDVDLPPMQLICKYRKGVRLLLCTVNTYNKYAWVVICMGYGLNMHGLKEKKGITITNAFQKILDVFGRKSNKKCVDQVSEFYNRSMKSWLHDTRIEAYSTHNKEKPVVAENLSEP